MEKMRLRSSVPPEERERQKKQVEKQKQDNKNRPHIQYKGKLSYSTTFIDCAIVCDKLLSQVIESQEVLVVGFDIEWPFNFTDGPGKASVIQISPSLNECHVLHLTDLKKLPKSLVDFLAHPNVRLTGVNIKNDIRKLARDFAGIEAEAIINNCVDCGVLANTVLPVRQRWSMEKLVDYCLKMKINKDKSVRNSKWHIIPLSKEQLHYAAIDAYVSLKLYFHLKELETTQAKEQDKNATNILQ